MSVILSVVKVKSLGIIPGPMSDIVKFAPVPITDTRAKWFGPHISVHDHMADAELYFNEWFLDMLEVEIGPVEKRTMQYHRTTMICYLDHEGNPDIVVSYQSVDPKP